jgi:hypothetical protein
MSQIVLGLIQKTGYRTVCPHLKCYPECNKLSYDEDVSTSPYDDYVDQKVREFYGLS